MFVVTRILGMGGVFLRLFLMGALRLVVDLGAKRRGGSGVGDGGLDGCGDRVERQVRVELLRPRHARDRARHDHDRDVVRMIVVV